MLPRAASALPNTVVTQYPAFHSCLLLSPHGDLKTQSFCEGTVVNFLVNSCQNDAKAVLQPNRTVLYSGKLGVDALHAGMRAAGRLDSAKPAKTESKVRYTDKPGTVLSI